RRPRAGPGLATHPGRPPSPARAGSAQAPRPTTRTGTARPIRTGAAAPAAAARATSPPRVGARPARARDRPRPPRATAQPRRGTTRYVHRRAAARSAAARHSTGAAGGAAPSPAAAPRPRCRSRPGRCAPGRNIRNSARRTPERAPADRPKCRPWRRPRSAAGGCRDSRPAWRGAGSGAAMPEHARAPSQRVRNPAPGRSRDEVRSPPGRPTLSVPPRAPARVEPGGRDGFGLRERNRPDLSLALRSRVRRVGAPPTRREGKYMAVKTIEELFIHELSDIYSAEKQLTKALPRLARAADAAELRSAFEDRKSVV